MIDHIKLNLDVENTKRYKHGESVESNLIKTLY